MMETNDKLIRDFFGEHKQEIADNGFSRRVMHRLPDRQRKLTRLWKACVATILLVLFFVFGGLQGLIGTLRDIFVSMVQHGATNFDPRTLIIVVVVLGFLGIHKAYSMI